MPSAKGGDHDSGVSRRMAGTFMTQMQDIKESVFWCFTANNVEELHEAFLADDRVDGVIYVHMPGAEARAACWSMYIKKFFPALRSDGKPFPLHLPVSLAEVLAKWSECKKASPEDWVDHFVAALLCVPAGEEREQHMAQIAKKDAALAKLIAKRMVDDEGWTPARIKSCCRLARKRSSSLTDVSKMMPRNQRGLKRAIARLEKWAAEEAIDAETGKAYSPATESSEDDKPRAMTTGRIRRKIRDV